MEIKNAILGFLSFFLWASSQGQSSNELIGKWKLVSWKNIDGSDKDIQGTFKTTEVYQVFKEGGEFESVTGDKINKGKWELSDDNKTMKLKIGITKAKFSVDYFDEKKRVMNLKGSKFEYIKM